MYFVHHNFGLYVREFSFFIEHFVSFFQLEFNTLI